MADHVFVCYAREDQSFVLALAQHLKEQRIPLWLDQWDLPAAGGNWNTQIDDALYDCACMLLVLSPAAVKSQRVEGEWVTALEEQKPIIPVLFQPCRIPSRLRLLQRIDLVAKGMDDTINLERLVVTLGGNRSVPVLPSPSLSPIIVPPPPPVLAPSFRNSIGMEFVLVPAGEFRMGGSDAGAYDDEKPVHLVRITKPFYLGKYQVTQGQWEAVMGTNPSYFPGDPNRPVEQVSWEETQEFVRRLGEQEGKAYRLPTEAEWEYAARAGSTGAYCFGDDESQLKDYAWYNANAKGTTHPVGQLQPNAWGLYDVHGNVAEWCHDGLRTYTDASMSDPFGPTTAGADRVIRGGNWRWHAQDVRSAYRSAFSPGLRYGNLGFRCASSV